MRLFGFKALRCLATLFVGLTALSAAQAMQAEFDDYVVHYSALKSTFLSPEIAREYQIQRSRFVGLVNISIHKKVGKEAKAVSATIDGKAKNLISQIKELKFKEVREGAAIYYIATFKHADQETLQFDLMIKPEGEKDYNKVSFSQQFFTD